MTLALVVGRRRKGRHIRRVVRETAAALREAGWEVDAAVVDRRSDVRRKAAEAVKRGRTVVVAVGGDGAVHEVVEALSGTEVALAIIPTGTGNLLAGNLGISMRREKALRTVITGIRRRIDVGEAQVGSGTFRFAVACGVGFDADVMSATGSRAKRRFGKLAYFAHAIAVGTRVRNVRVELAVDGEEIQTEAAQVMLANFGRMMAGLSPRRPIRPDDGVLEVVLVRASSAIGALPAAWEALRQTNLGESSRHGAFRAQASHVRVVTHPRLRVEVDGNVVGRTPVEARILPASLTVIVPAP